MTGPVTVPDGDLIGDLLSAAADALNKACNLMEQAMVFEATPDLCEEQRTLRIIAARLDRGAGDDDGR